MELRQLRYFVVLAETLHFGRAANLLHISQPPLSRQIAMLEEELGVVLFQRTQRSVALTAAGQRFYRDARSVLATLDQARSHARAAEVGDSGMLCAGFMFAVACSVLPVLTRAFAAAFPRIEVKLKESIPTDLAAELRCGKVDVGIMYSSDASVELCTETIFREPLVAALPAGHRLAARSAISVGELRDDAFIISPREASPFIHNTITDHCRQAGFSPRVRLETNFQQTIVNLVGQRLGVALVHSSMRSTRAENVQFVPLLHAPHIDVALVWSATSSNPCVQRFVQTAQNIGLFEPSDAALQVCA
ncbi:LysR family transcriptional regulator [Pandoraea sputorum]|uniref:LysR family transcriptional regulator n=1 Tax=Pandoraea sputorum TaxID=93222 RepID=A0A5E5BCZ9_9BURK|nr:LysR family transcriptional regulator [Pandoraea sputorum]BET13544.1 LysR family transcriptional regulator [Pandoraea sputorum]VVE83107.1 LysR family transcriptional regulator [Pandoraea sputorum]